MLPHRGKLLLFALLSLADLALTKALIQQGLGQVYEANPVAAWCLWHHGWAGLAAFKVLLVLSASGLSTLISLRRPGAGGRLLALGCAATAAVVLYSGYLAVSCAGPLDELRGALEDQDRVDAGVARNAKFWLLLERVGDDLAGDRRSLAEALAELEAAAQRQPDWVMAMQCYHPDRPPRQLLALCLMNRCVSSRTSAKEALAAARRLDGAFRSLFGVPPPATCRQPWPGPLVESGTEPTPVSFLRRAPQVQGGDVGPQSPPGPALRLGQLPQRRGVAHPRQRGLPSPVTQPLGRGGAVGGGAPGHAPLQRRQVGPQPLAGLPAPAAAVGV